MGRPTEGAEPMSFPTNQDERQYAEELVEAAEEYLRQRGIRNVLCEYEEGVLLLRGEVRTDYHKQLIQEAVIHLSLLPLRLSCGSQTIAEVSWVGNEWSAAPQPR